MIGQRCLSDVLEMSYGGRGTRRERVEEENNQNYRKLNQNYQKFILFNDNSNNFRSHQLPRATREIFIKQKYGFLEAYKNMATLSQFRGRSLGELQFRV